VKGLSSVSHVRENNVRFAFGFLANGVSHSACFLINYCVSKFDICEEVYLLLVLCGNVVGSGEEIFLEHQGDNCQLFGGSYSDGL